MSIYQTDALEFTELLAANSTATSFTANAATTTEPTGTGIVTLSRVNGRVHDNVLLVFFGTDANNETFDARVTGWSKVGTLWVPVVLAEFECILGAGVGVSGASVADTDFFVDTIAIDAAFSGLSGTAVQVCSPTGDQVAHVLMDMKGFAKMEVEFDLTGGASANCLYKLL